ncbi:histidine kinase [Streptomyces eurocidicus]|uniref:histidine kinase n=1 Tax=Streptomyces eurocidicus TaxID=66423 RepID=A0A2N8P1M9_STREU|nr:histidine kinase [Streptomyces eurocidicus]MBB5118471.1 signal transduction histidine kinase [Streptomyces eurocidicus]MBF6051923.1 two-component sensor histidine kinase [Streptomyces eurocidicus]PNE34923.1 histidine kinase [Streptomyces eurocidicus]
MNRAAGWAARHPRLAVVAKAALGVVLLCLVAFEGRALARQPSQPHAMVLAAGVVVCLCAVPYGWIPLHVRAAVAAAVSLTTSAVLMTGPHPAAVWGMGEDIALLVLLTAVLQRSPSRAAATLGPLLGIACLAAPMRDLDPGRFTAVFGTLTVVVTAYSLLLRGQSGQRMRDMAAVRTAERLELARELHDLVAHHVTGIVVQAQAARFTALDGPAAAAAFERIESSAGESLSAMRRLVGVLREGDAETEPVAGLPEVRALTEAFARTGPPVVLYIEQGMEHWIPADVAAGVHRVVREALTNIRKHAADATAVRIGLRGVPAGVELRIADDGGNAAALPEKARGGGFGLVGLRERVNAMGGILRAGPAPEGGWEVTALFPTERCFRAG